MKRPFVVMSTRGPAWDDAGDLENQIDWTAHAAFMDALAAERFILVGGPLEGTRDVVLVFHAESSTEIMNRLASDPWIQSGLLIVKDCRPWQIRLGSLHGAEGGSGAQS